MDNLKFKTTNGIDKNIEKISAIFPEVITETKDENGNIIKAVDTKKLSLLLGDSAVDSDYKECYEFTWPGKNEAIMEAAKATTNTLRPCKEESKNWDTTQNLYIEGDNLEVLKLLQESYLGKVKMIYIDPPYNTGKDFVYRDNFHKKADEYKEENTERDEEENQLFQNNESNGRFHSDWCSMIYPRLKLARDLLREDGVIFISIDDNEVHNLRKICDEIFGNANFIAQIVWERAYAPINLMKHFSNAHDYIVCYAINVEKLICNGIQRSSDANDRYSNPDNDPRGAWKASDISVGPAIEKNIYPIKTPSGRIVEPPAGRSWSLSQNAFWERLQDNRIWFGPNGNNVPSLKRFLSELKKTGITPMTVWKYTEVGHSQDATKDLMKLFDGKKYFDYPKPVELLKRSLSLYTTENDIVLDFFSGSATTAHACMRLNAEDGGNRKFIMVQLPEVCAPDSEAAKAGYKNICEIGKERIRRAGEKIKAEHATTAPNLDIGFRVLKLDSSNMKDVFYSPDEISQDLLSSTERNIKEDRTPLDLLYSCLIDWGVDEGLSLPIKTETIDGTEVFTVNDGEIPDLIACFDENISTNAIKQIATKKPLRVIFRDSSFADSPAKINVTEIFKTISPNTTIKVL